VNGTVGTLSLMARRAHPQQANPAGDRPQISDKARKLDRRGESNADDNLDKVA